MATQLKFFGPRQDGQAPSTRYQGSKAKLVHWIWQNIKDLDFHSCLDVFGGTGSVAYFLKMQGKQVTFNDQLKFNAIAAKAVLENTCTRLSQENALALLTRSPQFFYDDFIERTFDDIYFLRHENRWLDTVCQNVQRVANDYEKAIAYFALFQSCIAKRPFNLFHRKNLYIRTAEVKRSFGNKATWDKPFEDHFFNFVGEANQAVFDNGTRCHTFCCDAVAVPGHYDLVYIDPPYLNREGVGVDYSHFYHFLEGITAYQDWEHRIDYRKKHKPLRTENSPWSDPHAICAAFEKVFERYNNAIFVVSYRGDGIPSEEQLARLIRKFKKHLRVTHQEKYKYVLSTNNTSREMLLVGW